MGTLGRWFIAIIIGMGLTMIFVVYSFVKIKIRQNKARKKLFDFILKHREVTITSDGKIIKSPNFRW